MTLEWRIALYTFVAVLLYTLWLTFQRWRER